MPQQRAMGSSAGKSSSRRREAALALIAGSFVVLALLAVFAVKLADTQAGSKRDVKARVRERAELATALIDSLFNTTVQQLPQLETTYGRRNVSAAALEAQANTNLFIALLDARGGVVAASKGYTTQARAEVERSSALALARRNRPYAIGDVVPYASTGAIPFVIRVPTRYGTRYLVSGSRPAVFNGFISGELRKIPGVSGSHNYLIDGHNRVIASTNPAIPAGAVLSRPSEIEALSHISGDRKGHYYLQRGLSNSTLRIVLSAPDGPLFASVTGLHKWLPWAIFAAFALFAVIALVLGRRALRAAEHVREANKRLERVNGELASSNGLLERRAAELARSNGELEQFASIASHDLQEPLRKVRTFTHRLSESEGDRLTPRGLDYLIRANRGAERMQRLIEDLLKFSRVATHGRPFEDVDLGQIVSEVLDDLEAQIEETGANVQIGELPTVTADAFQMRQLLQNLISNAIKFRRPNVAPMVRIDADTQDDDVHLRVSDNGIGFEPRYADRIFRVFERLNGRGEYEGTGIGLALCRKIADRHGGTVFAESDPGAGSTFTVVLPQEPSLWPTSALAHDSYRMRDELNVVA